MTLEEAGNWGGTMTDIGPLYPMVGSETILVVIGLVIWIGWHIWQFRMENSNYRDDLKTLRHNGNMKRRSRGNASCAPCDDPGCRLRLMPQASRRAPATSPRASRTSAACRSR